MKRIKLYAVLFAIIILSLFFINEIYGIFTKVTRPTSNTITVNQKTSYTVVHEIMNLDGTTYSEYSRTNYSDIQIGTIVTPATLTIEGFNSPSSQSVILDSYDNVVITYRYTRRQYRLTINNSNYVTTNTPSGLYYYGQEIHLVANSTDNDSNPFVKWSNNITNRDYTFIIKNDITIAPLYAEKFVITYQPNNGDSLIIDYVGQNQSLGSTPSLTYDDCVSSNGDYSARQCTYSYKFEGWYTEPTFVNQVNESYVPRADTILYAKWNKVYYANAGPYTCDGSNYIDTGVKMFSQENYEKDFIVTFVVNENNGYNLQSGDRGSIFANMNENGEPYPGVQFFTGSNRSYTMNINTTGRKVKNSNTGYVTGQKVVIKKINGLIYYNYADGQDVQINDFSNFSTYFNDSALFCAGINKQGNYFRFFKGIVSGMSVELIDPDSYTIHFDANGGEGMMIDQIIKLGNNTSVSSNQFTREDYLFVGWNTAPDGTGTSYIDNYNITSDLANNGEVITLYAQWLLLDRYYVHFDSNGGTGSMENQKFIIDSLAKSLTANTFIRTGYVFKGWNTASDGTGTHYDDEQSVSNLSLTNEDIITLYAEWWKIEYEHIGDAIFDGTINTFIDTGVNIFSAANINKDFEIRFTFKSVDSDIFEYTPTQPTLFNVKDESNSKYPGFNVRFNGNINLMNSTNRWGGGTQTIPSGGISTSNAPIYFVYRRKNGVITLQYSYANYESNVLTLITQSSWTLNQPFATNVAFGGFFDGSNTPGRFFKGTLSDLIVLMDD